MLISRLGCSEHRGNHASTSKYRFKNLKIHELRYFLEFQTLQVVFLFLLFQADIDKKYRNENEKDKSDDVTFMEFLYLTIRLK